MNEAEKRYYSATPILDYAKSINCPFVGIAGGKGNGKTYDIIRIGLNIRIKEGYIMRYLRRYAESIKPKALQSLCKPHRQTLINLTNGKYNDFNYYQNRFWLVRRDETGKIVEKDPEPFIVCNALNSVEAFTGTDEGECSMIFYDEFLSREKELNDEYYNLMIYHSNCVRNRVNKWTPLILVGNTVTRNSCLITEFGVNLYEMKKGEITVVKNSKNEPKIVFEYCDEVEVMTEAADAYYNRFNDNDRIKMIYKGDWTIGNYPHLPKQVLKNSCMMCRIKIIAPSNRAICFEFHVDESRGVFGYVQNYFSDALPKICTLLNKQILTQYDVFNYLPQRGIFRKFIALVYTRNVFFESCEVGEQFRDFLKNFTGAQNISNVYK